MAEELRIKNGDKQEMYETLLPQIASLVGNETDQVANMANIAAALKQTFGFFWVGFYPYDHRTGCRRFPGTYRL